MVKRGFLRWVALAAMVVPVAGCQCSGDPGRAGSTGAAATASGAGTGEAKVTLAEAVIALKNGAQVEVVSGDCGEGAALVVLLDVGLDHDPPGRSGMARLAGRVLATSGGAGKAERKVETGSDYTLYSVAASGERVLDEVDEVGAWMSKMAPTEADLTRERGKMLEELGKLTGADAAMTAASYAEEAVLPTRGNGRRAGVTKEVNAITLEELQAFWKAHFRAGNARVVVAGKVDAEKVKARVEAALGGVESGTPGVLREPGDSTVKGTLVMGDAPRAVAIAVPAPPMNEPLYGAFLVLAGRLMEKSAEARTWEASYEPIARPEVLFITGPVGGAEQPEPTAGRMRTEAGTLLAKPLTAEDVAKARERFRLLVEPKLVDPAMCAADARAFATARARRAQLGAAAAGVGKALDAVTKDQLEEAAKMFETKKTAAVIAGGTIR